MPCMFKGKTLEFFYHPALISFILWIVLSLILPFQFTKYRIRILSEESIFPEVFLYYNDLDNDGSSEYISIDIHDSERTKIIVRKNDRILDQYNLPYRLANNNAIIFKDCNNDGYKEIIVFTLSDDEIFLNLIDPISTRSLQTYKRLIDKWAKPLYSNNKPCYNNIFSPDESHISESKNFTFIFSSGFCLQPRNLYKYFFDSDSLIKSPESYATITGCIEYKEPFNSFAGTYLISTQATGNTNESVSYSDQFCWLMVLDENLKFRFDPLQIGEYPSRIQVLPLVFKETAGYLVYYDYYGTESILPAFYIIDNQGNKIKEQTITDIDPEFSTVFANVEDNYQSFYLLRNHESRVDLIDASLNVIRSLIIPEISAANPLACLDVDMDGKKEYFFSGRDRKTLIICKHDFRHPVQYQFNHDLSNSNYSIVFKKVNEPLLFIQADDRGYLARYGKNWLYYLKVPYYFLLFGLLYLFIALIYNIQKKRLELKTATEKKLATLQIRAIKGQLDPHFTLNVLNAIGSLYATEGNREKADYIFGKYAKMIRQTVISSDEIIITLEEEIDFIRNYLEIERFRSNNNFNYLIEISPGINMLTKIPRMLIHSFVENSVKYGIRKRSGGGMLKITLKDTQSTIIISVEDNGPGITQEMEATEGTGKGLKLVNELTELYYRLEKIRITTTLENITQTNLIVRGSRAIIILPKIQN